MSVDLSAEAIPSGGLATLKLWLDMTRPRVIALVLFTGLPILGMMPEGWPGLRQGLLALFGTALAGAASSTLNAWMERETDARMARTRSRPLPAASVAPSQALWLGVTLTAVSTIVLGLVGGWVPAAVGLGTILFYVIVYTWYLKPRTPQNIVIGGAAGATTPFITEAALTGHISLASVILFAIVFLWTPPHFWAIAIYRKQEYANAGFPMMPNVIGDRATRRQSLAYTILLIAISLLPVALGMFGLAYGVVAVFVGGWFLAEIVRSMRADDPEQDYRVFRVSILYLFLLFASMLVDLAIRPVGYLSLPGAFAEWFGVSR